jgi:flagellar biogenesis protein FliO
MPPMTSRISEAISSMKQTQIVPKEHVSCFKVKDKRIILGEQLDHIKSFDLLVAQIWYVLATR